ncbi:MAG TPA: prephenate dehydrogenase/arogenate dehydrogenase family protein [Candidatus Dormibacteraeota bacterium]
MNTIAVVGLGLMGGSLAMALKRARPDLTLIGVDRDQRTLAQALQRDLVTMAGPDLDAAGAADLMVLAVPVLAMRRLLPRLAGTRALVTDLASTKAEVMGWAAAAGVDLVGGHPMCGREASGLEAADPELYQGATWVLTRSEPRLEDLIRSVGAHPLVLDAEVHDRLVAGISHAAFLVSAAYLLSVAGSDDWPEAGRLASSGFRDMTRLAAGDPEMYAGIAATNRTQIAEALDRFQAALARLRRHLDGEDPRLAELLEEARGARRRWEEAVDRRA